MINQKNQQEQTKKQLNMTFLKEEGSLHHLIYILITQNYVHKYNKLKIYYRCEHKFHKREATDD